MKRQGRAHAMQMAASHVFIMLLAAAAPLCGVEAETQRKYVALMENVGNPNSASARRLFGKGVDAASDRCCLDNPPKRSHAISLDTAISDDLGGAQQSSRCA